MSRNELFPVLRRAGSEHTLWESLVLSSDDGEPDPGYPSQKDVSHFPGNFLLRGMQGGACEGFVGFIG